MYSNNKFNNTSHKRFKYKDEQLSKKGGSGIYKLLFHIGFDPSLTAGDVLTMNCLLPSKYISNLNK